MPTPAVISRPAPPPSPPSAYVSARVLLAGLRRGWRWCVALPLAAMLLAAMAAPLLPNWYEASVVVQVSDGNDPAAPAGSPSAAAATLAAGALAASPQVVGPVVRQLGLAKTSEFAPRRSWTAVDVARLGERFHLVWRGWVQDVDLPEWFHRLAARVRFGSRGGMKFLPGHMPALPAAAARSNLRRGAIPSTRASDAPAAGPAASSIPSLWAGNEVASLSLPPLEPLGLTDLPIAVSPPLPRREIADAPSRAPLLPPLPGVFHQPHLSDRAADPPRATPPPRPRPAPGSGAHPSPGNAVASKLAQPGGAKLAGIAATLLSRLQVQPDTHSDLLTLTYRDHDPRLAAAIANAVAAELQTQAEARTAFLLQRRAASLAAALHGVKAQWQAAARALLAFRTAHAADALPPGAGQSAAMARLMALSQALTRADIDLWRQQALVVAGRGQPGQSPARANASAQARLANLWLQRAELAAQESRLAAQYGPSALPLVQARRALASIQTSLLRYRRALLSGHRVSARADRWERTHLQAAVAREGALLAVAERNAAQDATLAAQVQMRRDFYQRLWRRQRQLALRREAQPPALQVLAPAVLPLRPVRMPWRIALAAAAAFGLLAGIALAVGGDLLAPRVYEANVAALGLPQLGTLPRRQGPRWDWALDELWVTWAMAASAETTFLFTSSRTGEGKTTVTTALAQRLAAAGHSVLVLDCNFASPRLTVQWAARPFPGLAEYLGGRCSLEALFAAIAPPPMPSRQSVAMAVLPTGAWRPELAGALAGPALTRLLAEATKRYDWVFLDAGAVSGQAEARLLAHACDATVLVAALGATRLADAQAAVRMLRSGAAKKLALILNSVSAGTEAVPAAPAVAPAAEAASAASGGAG